ncbi:MAG: aminotransferase class I/II-fold pyridoxal phosphate-dependent enzyme [Rhodospirillaceae bacterium]|nr:aminotransferase class I/II-fold pyridoxal phosphate-dependent enzyme [Rhodospirillaceae bacterium]
MPDSSSSTSPWIPADAASFIERHTARYDAMAFDALDAEAHRLVAAHEQLVDHDCINLYAGTNIPNPRGSALLASTIGSRPNLGHPGAKYNKGMQHAEQLEVMLSTLLKRLFKARFVEHRVGSGSLANLYAYMATCRPGDSIMAFPDAAAGHPTHHAIGAAGLYGLEVHDVPFDVTRMDVDADGLRDAAKRIRPKLIIVAGSMCLFPYNLAAVRAVADEVGAYVLYDAAHMGGLIAGGEFQQPLAEGADLMTGSTYKSFGGPPSGMILTNAPELAERLDRIAFPGLTANFDLGRTAAMIIAVLDLLAFGPAYAKACIANARALAAAMSAEGITVFKPAGRDQFTTSQHVALNAIPYGGGNAASARIEPANILFTSIGLPLPEVKGDANGIRIGTQEITRWGFTPADMAEVAALCARVLVKGEAPERVQGDVTAFRRQFQDIHFIRKA